MAIFGEGAVGAYVGGPLAQAEQQVAFVARGDYLQALARHVRHHFLLTEQDAGRRYYQAHGTA